MSKMKDAGLPLEDEWLVGHYTKMFHQAVARLAADVHRYMAKLTVAMREGMVDATSIEDFDLVVRIKMFLLGHNANVRGPLASLATLHELQEKVIAGEARLMKVFASYGRGPDGGILQ